MVWVTSQVVLVNEQVVVTVQLPKLAVDDVEVLITEVLRDLIDIVFHLQCFYDLQQVGATQFGQSDLPTPRLVDTVVDPAYHLHINGYTFY